MANQSKLKAWVRYDGTGRVISGGPIFQVNKPKVGNWKQIDANLCCNGGSTTTTTTTSGGGGGTPTAWVVVGYNNQNPVCVGSGGITSIAYTSSSTLTNSDTIWSDAALTIPWGITYTMQYYLIFQGDTAHPNSYWNITTSNVATYIYNPTTCP